MTSTRSACSPRSVCANLTARPSRPWRYGTRSGMDVNSKGEGMQNSFGLLLLIVFGGAGLISILAVISMLLPTPVGRARAALEASLGRSLLLGLVNFLFVTVVDALLIWLGQMAGKVVGGVLVVL